MCGIELVVTNGEISTEQWEKLYKLCEVMRKRGPDYQSRKSFDCKNKQTGWIKSSVLHLRGNSVTPQPIIDPCPVDTEMCKTDFLSWNGEIFSGSITVEDHENDGTKLYNELRTSSKSVPEIFSSIHGPFAFCYWEVMAIHLYQNSNFSSLHKRLDLYIEK